jgi:hypothetical protein
MKYALGPEQRRNSMSHTRALAYAYGPYWTEFPRPWAETPQPVYPYQPIDYRAFPYLLPWSHPTGPNPFVDVSASHVVALRPEQV